MVACELCKLVRGNIITKCYYNEEDFLIVDCKTCGPNVPMLVVKKHTMQPPIDLIDRMIIKAKELFGENILIRKNQRQIKDHLHYHVICR